MIGLVSGMSAPHFWGRIFVGEKIRPRSRLKLFLSFVLIGVRCFPVSPEVRVHQVEGHWVRLLNGPVLQFERVSELKTI
jgi:hypothetical protein